MDNYLDGADRYMWLALKALGQCRSTLEYLVVIISRINNGPQDNNAAPPNRLTTPRVIMNSGGKSQK